MSKSKKLFADLSKLTVGAITGVALTLAPQAVFADDHEGHGATGEEAGEKSCSGDTKCSGEKGCGGDKGCSGEKEGHEEGHEEAKK